MNRIAQFEKVSYKQYAKDYKKLNPNVENDQIKNVYDQIKLPKRATAHSAGYDFYIPYDLELKAGEETLIPTGIRVKMNTDYVLMLYPRSSLGFKYRLQLNNTVGVIDSDYYGADNEGHIFARVLNDSREGKTLNLSQGDGMMQGIFTSFGITIDDDTDTKRTGGLGSTNRKCESNE